MISTAEFIWLLVFWLFALGAGVAALIQAYRFYQGMLAEDEGTPRMVEIAGFVRAGAAAYLRQQYIVVSIVFAVVFVLLSFAAFGLAVLSPFVPFAFLLSGFLSGLAGFIGMRTATWASSRTAAAAQKSLNSGLQVAFRSGAVMGLVVVGLALLDICFWYLVLRMILGFSPQALSVIMLGFGMGASAQALFARVGGGIFTKAADVGADLVGKVEKGIPEDDPRNPATIADNVGDNVGDVAGMGADLYESFYGSLLASAALGAAAFSNPALLESVGITADAATISLFQTRAMLLPLSVAAAGVLLSIVGIFVVRTEEDAQQQTLLRGLNRGISLAAILVAPAAIGLTLLLLTPTFWGVGVSIITGLGAGWVIGKWTEYSTSDEYSPTRGLADQAVTGPATLIIGGVAEGMLSTWVPVLAVAGGTLLAFGFACNGNFFDLNYFALGLFGVGVAAVGMLSTLGITLATDAYGPIADNAGGNAEMAHLDPYVRERTDALDSLGNTTAATGKGFAIGSAALTVLALMAAYLEAVRTGLDSWGRAAVAQKEPGIYKVNETFIVQVPDPDQVPEGQQPRPEGWLIMQTRPLPESWQNLQPSGGALRVDANTEGTSFRLPETTDQTGMLLVSEDNKVQMAAVPVSRATLRDFMNYFEGSLINPRVLVGVFLGAMATFVFCALTMKAVGRAAKQMVEEVRRQFREKPGIMDETEMPDYDAAVQISTKAAQQQMLFPTLLGLCVPLLAGLLLGVAGVVGLLVGALTTGFCVAIFMANAGGAWDNAKKYIESGKHGGKGTEAHKAAVVGDTVGDPFKDTSGPSLNILIKLMSMVSVVIAGLTVRYSLQALGLF